MAGCFVAESVGGDDGDVSVFADGYDGELWEEVDRYGAGLVGGIYQDSAVVEVDLVRVLNLDQLYHV